MPFRPQYEAIASIRSAIRSNSGPDVSERTKRNRSSHPWPVSGSGTMTSAFGFSAMLRRLLLKNWNESATCVGVDVVDVAQVRGVGNAVARAGEELRRQDALETGRERLERDAHASRRSRAGPGVWSKMALTRSRIATAGHVTHAPRRRARNADLLEVGEKAVPLPGHERPLGLGRRRARRRTIPFTWHARSSIGRPKLTAAWPLPRDPAVSAPPRPSAT